jgi:predicted AAA+ superfamily ATPase
MMIERPFYRQRLSDAIRRSPVTALLGPRQCGKTTLARMFSEGKETVFFDLELPSDVQRLQNPGLMLGSLKGLVVLDEIQLMPELFAILRVLADRPGNEARFLILGSASPHILKNVSESLAGRVEFVELSGFHLRESSAEEWESLFVRGGFPRSFLAGSDEDSMAWRDSFIRTFLERDIPQLGITIPSAAMRRFWMMLAHFHGQIWNASELARSMGLSDKTVRYYLDILTQTFMIRQLQPWYENIGKRQVKSPKIYLRDSGILHALIGISQKESLWGHPKIGASWEGFVIEQVLALLQPLEAFFWATHSGAEMDLLFMNKGKLHAVEVKFSEAPKVTKSMRTAMNDLKPEHLWIVYPGQHAYPAEENITVLPIREIHRIAEGLV